MFAGVAELPVQVRVEDGHVRIGRNRKSDSKVGSASLWVCVRGTAELPVLSEWVYTKNGCEKRREGCHECVSETSAVIQVFCLLQPYVHVISRRLERIAPM